MSGITTTTTRNALGHSMPWWHLRFVQIDPKTRTNTGSIWHENAFLAAPPGIVAGDTLYFIWQVPPGSYASMNQTTIMGFPRESCGSTISMQAAFTATAGQVIYIGDFVFVGRIPDYFECGSQKSSRGELEQIELRYDSERARQALRNYPAIRGELKEIILRPTPHPGFVGAP